MKNVTEQTISKHSILIQGINNELPVEEAIKSLTEFWPVLAEASQVPSEPPLVI